MSVQDTPAKWADAIADQINYHGIGKWLAELQGWLALPKEHWLPDKAEDWLDIAIPARGLVLRMQPLSTFLTVPAARRMEQWFIKHAIFSGDAVRTNPDRCALPFELDATAETPRSAGAKLGTDEFVSGEGEASNRVSFFLGDFRVVEIAFNEGLRGIKQVWVVKFGSELPREDS